MVGRAQKTGAKSVLLKTGGAAKTSRKAISRKSADKAASTDRSTSIDKEPPSGKETPAAAGRTNPVARRPAAGKAVGKSAGKSLGKSSGKEPSARPETSGDVQLGFLSDYVGFHLRLAQDASYRAFSRHRDKDLIKPGRFPALAIIHLNPGISQSALGRAIARDKSTVSPLIKDLQKNGFISRKPSPSDRRSVTLALTKKGERTLERLHMRAQDHESEIDRLVGGAKARLLTLLDKITGGLAE